MEVAARIQPVTATTLLRQSAGAARRPLWDHLAFALFVAAAALMLATFTDYGVTWDEDVHNWYGVYVLEYYLSFFRDLRSVEWGDVNNYGAAFDMTAAALNHLSPFGVYETRHLLIGIIGAWKLGRCLAGPRAGFIAALFLLLTPNYYGQMFNNPKDIPFAVGMVWAMYYLARIAPELPRPRWTLVVKLGIACGLALGVRVGGLLLFGYLGLLLLLFVLWRGAETRRLGIVIAESWTSFWRVLLPVLLVAWPVMLLFWPWAQQSPLLNPVRAIIYFSHEIFPFPTLFAGEYIPATNLPWAYLPVHIALALPELVFSLLVVAPVAAIVIAQRRRWAFDRTTTLRLFIVVFGIVFPVAYAIAIKAVLFDGMRHFIFVLPLIAALTAVVADRALVHLARLPLRPYALRSRPCLGHGDAAPRRIRLLQRLHRRRRRRGRAVQARLLGQLLCRGGQRARGPSARRIRRRFHGPRFHRRRLWPADLGGLLLPEQLHLHRRPRERRILHRLHQGQVQQGAAGQGDLSRRA